MQGIRVRRPLPWLVLSVLSLLLAPSWGCKLPQAGPSTEEAASTSAGEAERTRKIEEKAAEIQRKEEEIRNMQGSEQDKIDAVNELDRMRRELNDLQEGGS